MKARILILLSLAALFAAPAHCQTDNMIHVKSFPGANVGAMTANAMATCTSNTAIPCILVIDPSLAVYPAGTMPTLCSHCTLLDYRNPSAIFGGYPGVTSDGNYGLKVQNSLKAGSIFTSILNNVYYVNQFATGGSGTVAAPYTSPSGTGGIDECAAALPLVTGSPAASTCYLPSGYYYMTSTAQISQPMQLVGSGWNSLLWPSSSLSGDVIDVAPSPNINGTDGMRFADFSIIPVVGGTPGACGLHFQAGTGYFRDVLIDHLKVNQLGGAAICADGGGAQGSLVLTTIENSELAGGITCSNCGDSVHLLYNGISGTGTNQFAFIGGAAGFVFIGNNVTLKGGTQFQTYVTAPTIAYNEFETPTGFTGSNGALLDLNGGSGSGEMVGGTVAGNSFATVNGNTTNNLRINGVTGVTVANNTFGRGASPSTDVVLTASSAKNFVSINYDTSGLLISDSGSSNWTVMFPEIRTGSWTITSPATSAAVTFANQMQNSPGSCNPVASSDPTATGLPWASALTTSGFTVNVHTSPASSISGTYNCASPNTW